MTRYRSQFLLVTLFVLILALPILPALGDWSRYATAFFFQLMLLAAVIAASQRRITGLIALGLFVVTLLLGVTGLWVHTYGLQLADYIVMSLFLSLVIVMILKSVFTQGYVNFGTICAALSVYLLLAVLWAVMYGMVDLIDPGAFAFNTGIGGETQSMQFGQGRSVTPLYFSLVTITTLGYGDITPLSPAASMLAVVEAVIGQFYLTVLVAWLVGTYIGLSMKPKANQ